MLLSISISFICQTISITQFCKAAPYWVLIATPPNLCFCYYVYMCVYCTYLLYIFFFYYIKCCFFNILLVRFCILFAKFTESISACCSSKPMLSSYFNCCFMILRILTINITWFSAFYYILCMLTYTNTFFCKFQQLFATTLRIASVKSSFSLLFISWLLLEQVLLVLINFTLCVFLVFNTFFSDCSYLVLIEIAMKIFNFVAVFVLCLSKVFKCSLLKI